MNPFWILKHAVAYGHVTAVHVLLGAAPEIESGSACNAMSARSSVRDDGPDRGAVSVRAAVCGVDCGDVDDDGVHDRGQQMAVDGRAARVRVGVAVADRLPVVVRRGRTAGIFG